MRGRRLVASVVGLIATGLVPVSSSNAFGVQFSCLGQPATIVGTPGDDRGATALQGTNGDDVIVGLGGDDRILGRGGDDLICGNGDDDDIDPGPGDDAVEGQGGNDTIRASPGTNVLDGGAGVDVVSYASASGAATVSLLPPATGTYVGQQGSDTLERFEAIIGSAFDDDLGGDRRANLIDGGSGDDIIRGRGGPDELLGGPDDDKVFGEAGDDLLTGGDGFDRSGGGTGSDQCWQMAIERDCETVLVELPVNVHDYRLRDLGVVDVDGDAILDLFTSNHFSADSLLVGDGTGGFTDQVSAWRFHQDPELPGLEDRDVAPAADQPGLHLYFWNKHLYLDFVTGGPVSMSGTIAVLGDVNVVRDDGLVTGEATATLASGLTQTTFDFFASSDGLLELDIFGVGAPVSVSLDTPADLGSVLVGFDAVNPSTSDFELSLRDRHAYAWSDLDGDQHLDVAIVRGGLHRLIDLYPVDIRDELLVFAGTQYGDEAVVRGLDKGDCPGSAAEWVDVDGDGLTDLFVVCSTPSLSQVHLRASDGSFSEAGADLGLAIDTQGPVEWVDLDADHDMDLLVPEDDGLWLYRNGPGGFVPELLLAEPIPPVTFGPALGALRASDFDVDGDLDVLVADSAGNRLLANVAGVFQLTPLDALDLPASSRYATWVDYDNDGLPDLHTVPDGLFRQNADGSFTHVPLVLASSESGGGFVMASWFDLDNDGDRDLLGHLDWADAAGFATRLFTNAGTTNHWLEISLVGPSGNPHAIGAQVVAQTPTGPHIQEVGAAEGALFSQGHYRMYFGLGAASSPISVELRWPDGLVETVEDIAVDQLVTFTHPSA